MIPKAIACTWVLHYLRTIVDVVIEYCKHGPVMDIGLDSRAKPYSHERARHIFRDLLLGIEYCPLLFTLG